MKSGTSGATMRAAKSAYSSYLTGGSGSVRAGPGLAELLPSGRWTAACARTSSPVVILVSQRSNSVVARRGKARWAGNTRGLGRRPLRGRRTDPRIHVPGKVPDKRSRDRARGKSNRSRAMHEFAIALSRIRDRLGDGARRKFAAEGCASTRELASYKPGATVAASNNAWNAPPSSAQRLRASPCRISAAGHRPLHRERGGPRRCWAGDWCRWLITRAPRDVCVFWFLSVSSDLRGTSV